MKLRISLLIGLAGLVGSSCLPIQPAPASPAPSPSLSTVNVVDLNGGRHTIPDRKAPANVIIFIAHDCPISCALLPEVDRIRKDYPSIPFYIVYAEPNFTDAAARLHAKQYAIGSTCISANWKMLVKWSGAWVTPEAVVVTKSGTIAYEGRINNKFTGLGIYRSAPTSNELRDALSEISHGQTVRVSKTTPIGCTIETMLLRGNG
jgi:hypothetical protein